MLQWRIQRRGPGRGAPFAPRPPPGGLGPPLIFRPNWGPKGRNNFFRRPGLPPGWPLPPSPALISRSRRGTVLFFNKFFLLFLPSALQIRFRCQGYLEGFFTIQQIGMCDVVICLYGQTSGKRPHKLRRVSGRLRQVVAYDSPTAGGFFSKRGPRTHLVPSTFWRESRELNERMYCMQFPG